MAEDKGKKRKRWLNIYVSEGPVPICRFIELGVVTDYLISFAHFAKNPAKVPKDFLKTVRKSGHKLMLDSGAITNMTKPGTVELEPYREYLKSEGDFWDEYVTLDALGSRSGTIANFHSLKSDGLRPLFVDHLKYDTDKRSTKIFQDEDKLCLSGWGKKPLMNKKPQQDKADGDGAKDKPKTFWESGKKRPKGAELARRLNERIEMARGKSTKVHLLAVGSLLKFLPFMDVISSADTAAPTRAVGYGSLIFASEKTVGGVVIPVIGYTQAPFASGGHGPVVPEVQKRFKEWRASTRFKNQTENTAARCWNILQTKKYEGMINAITPQEIMDAFAREQKERKAALAKSAVFSFPSELDPWHGIEPGDVEAIDPADVVEKAQDVLLDVLVEQAEETIAGLIDPSLDPVVLDPEDAIDVDLADADRSIFDEPPPPADDVEAIDVKLMVDKADDDQRIVFGVVLEPNEVDTQGDTIKQEEITTAAHLWLARYQDRGLMHKEIVNGKIEIYESYLAPTDLTIGGQKVKKGTWLLMYHILDDALWKAIKSGELTGFSMGGFARRKPT